jgi:hypothetical protein
MAECLKKFEEITEPDVRWRGLVIRDETTERGWRPIMLRDIYDATAKVHLNPTVPADVQAEFATAQNLFIYSWYFYTFSVPAAFSASRCVERALRHRFDDEKTSFAKLLNRAIADGLLSDAEGERCTAMRHLRNSMAHDRPMVHNDGLMFVSFAAVVINRLYPVAPAVET